MATPPTFTVGQVLTAAQMNAVGMWEVATASLSGSSTTISNCFTSDYDNYRIVIGNLDLNTNTTRIFSAQFTSSGTPATSNYDWWSQFIYSAGSGTEGNAGASYWQICYYSGNNDPSGLVNLEIGNPAKTGYTTCLHQVFAYQSGAGGYVNRNGGGVLKNSSAYDGIKFMVDGDSMSGTVHIYGYRN